eukprot:g1516.t1
MPKSKYDRELLDSLEALKNFKWPPLLDARSGKEVVYHPFICKALKPFHRKIIIGMVKQMHQGKYLYIKPDNCNKPEVFASDNKKKTNKGKGSYNWGELLKTRPKFKKRHQELCQKSTFEDWIKRTNKRKDYKTRKAQKERDEREAKFAKIRKEMRSEIRDAVEKGLDKQYMNKPPSTYDSSNVQVKTSTGHVSVYLDVNQLVSQALMILQLAVPEASGFTINSKYLTDQMPQHHLRLPLREYVPHLTDATVVVAQYYHIKGGGKDGRSRTSGSTTVFFNGDSYNAAKQEPATYRAMHTEGIVEALKPFLTWCKEQAAHPGEEMLSKIKHLVQDRDCVVDLHGIESALHEAELLAVQKDLLLVYARGSYRDTMTKIQNALKGLENKRHAKAIEEYTIDYAAAYAARLYNRPGYTFPAVEVPPQYSELCTVLRKLLCNKMDFICGIENGDIYIPDILQLNFGDEDADGSAHLEPYNVVPLELIKASKLSQIIEGISEMTAETDAEGVGYAAGGDTGDAAAVKAEPGAGTGSPETRDQVLERYINGGTEAVERQARLLGQLEDALPIREGNTEARRAIHAELVKGLAEIRTNLFHLATAAAAAESTSARTHEEGTVSASDTDTADERHPELHSDMEPVGFKYHELISTRLCKIDVKLSTAQLRKVADDTAAVKLAITTYKVHHMLTLGVGSERVGDIASNHVRHLRKLRLSFDQENDGKMLDQMRRIIEKSQVEATQDHRVNTWSVSQITYDNNIITRREMDDVLKGWFTHPEVAESYATFVHQQQQAGDGSKGLGQFFGTKEKYVLFRSAMCQWIATNPRRRTRDIGISQSTLRKMLGEHSKATSELLLNKMHVHGSDRKHRVVAKGKSDLELSRESRYENKQCPIHEDSDHTYGKCYVRKKLAGPLDSDYNELFQKHIPKMKDKLKQMYPKQKVPLQHLIKGGHYDDHKYTKYEPPDRSKWRETSTAKAVTFSEVTTEEVDALTDKTMELARAQTGISCATLNVYRAGTPEALALLATTNSNNTATILSAVASGHDGLVDMGISATPASSAAQPHNTLAPEMIMRWNQSGLGPEHNMMAMIMSIPERHRDAGTVSATINRAIADEVRRASELPDTPEASTTIMAIQSAFTFDTIPILERTFVAAVDSGARTANPTLEPVVDLYIGAAALAYFRNYAEGPIKRCDGAVIGTASAADGGEMGIIGHCRATVTMHEITIDSVSKEPVLGRSIVIRNACAALMPKTENSYVSDLLMRRLNSEVKFGEDQCGLTVIARPLMCGAGGIHTFSVNSTAITVESIEAPNFNPPVLTEIHGHFQFPPGASSAAHSSKAALRPRNAHPKRPLSVNEIMIQQQLARHKLVLELAGTEAGQAVIASALAQEEPVPVALCAAPVGETAGSATQPIEADGGECPDFL